MKCSIVFAVFVLVIAAANGDVDDSSPNLQDLAGKLPSIPGFDTSRFNASQVPTVEDAERLFKEKCLKNSNEAAYQHAKDAQEQARECVLSLVNVTVLQEEMNIAKPTGDLDEVFKKYCKKSPKFRECVSNFTASIEPCLDEPERLSKQIIQNVTDKLVEFICFKEGDRIAHGTIRVMALASKVFIAEGGPDCLKDHQEGIQECVNTTLKRHIPNEVPSIENLPMLIMGVEECKDMRSLQRCVVGKLEKCKEPTPANIVESMFNFVYKVTPCGAMDGDGANEPDSLTAGTEAGGGGTLFVLGAAIASLVATRVL